MSDRYDIYDSSFIIISHSQAALSVGTWFGNLTYMSYRTLSLVFATYRERLDKATKIVYPLVYPPA